MKWVKKGEAVWNLKLYLYFLLPFAHFHPSHCVKRVRIRSFSGPYFPVFGLNTNQEICYFYYDSLSVVRVMYFLVIYNERWVFSKKL